MPIVNCGQTNADGTRCGAPAPYGRCSMHHAVYMRIYRRILNTRRMRQARREGWEAMRATAIRAFEHLGGAEVSGLAAAEMLRQIGPEA